MATTNSTATHTQDSAIQSDETSSEATPNGTRSTSAHSRHPDQEIEDVGFNLLTNPIPHRRHVFITPSNDRTSTQLFTLRPLTGPLVFLNSDSTARDHCANERTFLSWLRLSVYLAIVSVAIVMSFHLKNQPTPTEKRAALPLGLLFWLLSIASLGSGLANYVRTVWRYSRRQALVQSGWKTQVVFTIVACAIVAACVLFLAVDATEGSSKS